MKMRIGIIVSLLFVVVLGIVLAAVGFRSPASSPEDLATPIAVSMIRNDVFLKTSEHAFAVLPERTLVSSGSVVRTSETGRALVETSEGHTSIVDPGSEVVLAHADEKNATSIEILTGGVWSRLENTFEQGEFELRTKTAAAVVRGTSFGMQAGLGGPTTVLVSEGSVLCYRRDAATGALIQESEVLAGAGTKAVWQSDGTIVVTPLGEKDRASEWYQYHNGTSSVKIQAPSSYEEGSAALEPAKKEPSVPVQTEPKTTPVSTEKVPPTNSSQPTPPPFDISSVSPQGVVADGTSVVRIQGTGFTKAITVTVGGVKAEGWSIESEREIRITIDAKIPVGTHDVAVVDIYGRTVTLQKSLTVREASKPQSPPTVNRPPASLYQTAP